MPDENSLLFVMFAIIALFYAAVGQAGASGYLAVMGVFDFSPETMKVTALALNLLVAGIGMFLFWFKGRLSWRDFYPFGILGIPFSLLGGAVQLPADLYYPVVGVILVLSALQMLRSVLRRQQPSRAVANRIPFFPALMVGAVIGFISGTTGTGGGVFLAPILLLMNWVSVREAAAVTAAYNLLNSAAALAGAWLILNTVPAELPVWLSAVAIGGGLGAFLGSRYLPETILRLVLMLIILLSGIKFMLS